MALTLTIKSCYHEHQSHPKTDPDPDPVPGAFERAILKPRMIVGSQVLRWWDAYTEGKGGDPYAALIGLLKTNAEPASMLPEWDTILIIVLCVLLGFVLLLRQRRALPN